MQSFAGGGGAGGGIRITVTLKRRLFHPRSCLPRLRPGSLVGSRGLLAVPRRRPPSLVVGLDLLAFVEKYFNVKLLFEERSDVVILGVD